MRKFLLFLSVAFIASCTNPQKQIQKDVESFLLTKFDDISYLEFDSVSPVDSLYSPFEDYNSILITYYNYINKLYEADKEAYDIATGPYYPDRIKDALRVKNEALAKYDDTGLKDLLQKAIVSVSVPRNPVLEKNRLGTEVVLKMMGETTTLYFYYNRAEKTIGHYTVELENTLKSIFEAQSKYREARSNLEAL